MKNAICFLGVYALIACNRNGDVLPAPDITALNALTDTAKNITLTVNGGVLTLPYQTLNRLPFSAGNQSVTIERYATDTLKENFLLPVTNGLRQFLVLTDTGTARRPFYRFVDRGGGGDTSFAYIRLLHLNPDTAYQNIALYINDTVAVDNARRHADWLFLNNTQRAAASVYKGVPYGNRRLDLRKTTDTASRFVRRQIALVPGKSYTILFTQRRSVGAPTFAVVED